MGCGCKERRAIGTNMVGALRRGDRTALRQHMGEMAASLGHDVNQVMRIRSDLHPAAPPVPEQQPVYRVRRF